MKVNSSRKWSSVLGAGFLSALIASFALLPQARGEMVYDSAEAATPAAAPVVLTPAVQAAPAVQVQMQALPPAQVQVGPAQSMLPAEVETLPRAELLRRERGRQEKNNEEAVRERLEELRLREELRRTEQVKQALSGLGAPAAAQAAPADTGLVQQSVAAPVTQHPGQQQAGQAVMPVAGVSQASAEESDRTIMYISPRAGLNGIRGTLDYDIRPRFATGVAVGMVSSDNLSFEAGYSYGEYGIALNSANPYVQWANGYGYTNNTETVAMKQNVIDAGVKLHFLGPEAKLRPFVSGGAAYSMSYINYDQRILDVLNQNAYARTLARDYELSQYLGYLATGLDLRVNKSLSVGMTLKYYNVLSSRERSAVNNAALYGGYPYAGYNALPLDPEKQYVGGSLARTSFYSVMGGVNFVF